MSSSSSSFTTDPLAEFLCSISGTLAFFPPAVTVDLSALPSASSPPCRGCRPPSVRSATSRLARLLRHSPRRPPALPFRADPGRRPLCCRPSSRRRPSALSPPATRLVELEAGVALSVAERTPPVKSSSVHGCAMCSAEGTRL
ncbi:Os03g0277400 [Oryza sativa Japonica Group]|uniref:Os03g0277400 protein n=1 Tax=Oryza sativa subsp. japonica TaxID=39947 RepID=A0A0P0VW23_ORYSJ|nr:Os03g0277400 [Oryza sativa Japonica Group]